jgi:C1A family cysteine protease
VHRYDDFLHDYKNTVYEPGSGAKKVGGHAVVISGWGTERGKKFWWGINSWGVGWGIDGKFKIKRGDNTANIERAA